MSRRRRHKVLHPVGIPAETTSSTSRKETNASNTWSEQGSMNSNELWSVWQRIAMHMEFRILKKPRRARVLVVGLAKLLEETRDFFN